MTIRGITKLGSMSRTNLEVLRELKSSSSIVGPCWKRPFASSSSSPLVTWSLDEKSKVATITLQSSERFNPLTVDMGLEFQELVHQLRLDLSSNQLSNTVRAIIVTGQTISKDGPPQPAFSAGGNAQWLLSLKENPVHVNVDLMLEFYNSFLCIRTLPVPLLAALSGPAIGAGACLALACDMRFAAVNNDNTKNAICLGFPFAKLGIPSGMGASWLLQQAGVSTCKTNEILLTGSALTGPQAYDLGLVNKTAPISDENKDTNPVLQAAVEVAERIANSTHPVAVRSMVRSMRITNDDKGLQSALYQDALSQGICYNRKDWGEGVTSVMKKREPSFDQYDQW